MKLKRKYQQKEAFKPTTQPQTNVDRGLKAAFGGTKQQQPQQRGMFAPKQPQEQGQHNIPNYWGVKPLPLPKQPQQQQSMFAPKQQVQQQQPAEEEAYWSAEDWEEWAIALYNQFPDYRAILPDWFIEAMQQQ